MSHEAASTTASTLAAHLHTHVLVDDEALPLPYEPFSTEELSNLTLSQLYRNRCELHHLKPNPQILQQLPATKPHDRHTVMNLNLNNTYVGNKHFVAVIPLVEACPRLTYFGAANTGMKPSAALALLGNCLAVHPGIRQVNIAKNDLGTAVAKALLKLVRAHRRIHTVDMEQTLFIEPLRDKIKQALVANFEMRGSFSGPLIPEWTDEEELVRRKRREEEEEARKLREAALKKELAERVPVFVPAALMEFSAVLHKHRHSMENVFALLGHDHERSTFVSAQQFKRAMGIMGVTTLANDDEKVLLFADCFDSWNRLKGEINAKTIVHALRIHVDMAPWTLKGRAKTPQDTSAEENEKNEDQEEEDDDDDEEEGNAVVDPIVNAKSFFQKTLDGIYDKRQSLQDALESIDVDMSGKVRLNEFISGLASVANIDSIEAVELLKIVYPNPDYHQQQQQGGGAGGAPSDVENDRFVEYKLFFERLYLIGEDKDAYRETVARTDWASVTASELRQLVE